MDGGKGKIRSTMGINTQEVSEHETEGENSKQSAN